MMQGDWTHFDSIEVTGIMGLAVDCPYVGGPAVYKARTLAMPYLPSLNFDDLWICNSMGIYKNGNTRFAEENKLLNGGNTLAAKPAVYDEQYTVYPNPSSGQLSIAYEGTAERKAVFTLYDMLGNVILKKTDIGTYVSLEIPNIANGVYTYSITDESHIYKRGKLIIER